MLRSGVASFAALGRNAGSALPTRRTIVKFVSPCFTDRMVAIPPAKDVVDLNPDPALPACGWIAVRVKGTASMFPRVADPRLSLRPESKDYRSLTWQRSHFFAGQKVRTEHLAVSCETALARRVIEFLPESADQKITLQFQPIFKCRLNVI